MGLFDNIGRGLGLGSQTPAVAPGTNPNAAYQMPPVPYGQNQAITMAALGMLGAPNIRQGMQNAAQMVPAGLAANTARQRDMYTIQQENARKAQMNEALKNYPNLTPEQKAIFVNQPDLFAKYAVSTMMPEETYRPLTDPAERAKYGINPEDTSPYQVGPGNKISAVGGASTNISLNEGKLTEGQSKDVNFYARGRAADKELTPQLEKSLTDLPATMWSNTPLLGNYGQTPEFQSAKRAAAEFLAVVLRKDTGAAVTPQEFAAYGPMYLPVPGDTEEVLTAKRTARKRVMDSIKRGLGTARELADEIDTEMAAEPTSTSETPDDPLGIGGM